MNKRTKNQKNCGELHLLYQDSIDNIRFYKQQQWTITNYGILLYVAIVSLHEIFRASGSGPSDFEKGILVAAAVGILIVAGCLIVGFHKGMVCCRKRMAKIRDFFDETSIEAWEACDKPDHTSMSHNFSISAVLIGILLLGMLSVWWITYR